MQLTITCFPQDQAHEVGAAFNGWLPTMCCAEGCNKPAVFKLTGRAPRKNRRRDAARDWLCFEISLTLCKDHERSRLPLAVVELPEIQKHIKGIARAMGGAQLDMSAAEIAMIPFAIGNA